MEKISNVEQIFNTINTTATILKDELECSYLEAVAETGENIFQNTILQEELSELSKKRLEKEYAELSLDRFDVEDIRRAYQLAA